MTCRVSFYRADADARGRYARSVYERRPEPCHEVQIGDDKCLQARARHALPALP